jgi:hypothetical protein
MQRKEMGRKNEGRNKLLYFCLPFGPTNRDGGRGSDYLVRYSIVIISTRRFVVFSSRPLVSFLLFCHDVA